MVIENRSDLDLDPRPRPEANIAVDRDHDASLLNTGFRHNPAQDFREFTNDLDELAPSDEKHDHSRALSEQISQQYRTELLIGNIAAFSGFTPAGAHILSQLLLKGSVETGALSRVEVSRLFGAASDALEDVKLVSSVVRTSGFGLDELEGLRRNLREKSDLLKAVADKQAVQDLEAALKSHGVYSGEALRRIVASVEREMKYGNSRGERSSFASEDAQRVKNILDNSGHLDKRAVHQTIQTFLQESIGKGEVGRSQEMLRDLISESRGATQRAVSSLLDLYMAKGESFDRDDIATLVFLARDRAGRPEEPGIARPVTPALFSGIQSRQRGPFIDVTSMAGLDRVAEKVATEFALREGQEPPRVSRRPDLSLHILTHLDASKWQGAIEELKKTYDRQPAPPPLTMTGDQVNISKGIAIAFRELGIEEPLIEARRDRNGFGVKWHVYYDGLK
jgi:hypothetical protein